MKVGIVDVSVLVDVHTFRNVLMPFGALRCCGEEA